MLSIEPNPLQFNKSSMMAAIALEGKFNSLYRNRLLSQNDSAQYLTQSKATRMIVVSDGDIIKNWVSKKDSAVYPLGYDRFTKQTFANKNFILNAIDYLADDDNIIEARTKEVKLRTLDKGKIKKQKLNWQIFNILLPNLIIVVLGIVLFYSRKRKYTR
jgi:ABC-2 type transport system permease protein